MADEKKSIFDLADKFGVVSPFGNDWVKEDFKQAYIYKPQIVSISIVRSDKKAAITNPNSNKTPIYILITSKIEGEENGIVTISCDGGAAPDGSIQIINKNRNTNTGVLSYEVTRVFYISVDKKAFHPQTYTASVQITSGGKVVDKKECKFTVDDKGSISGGNTVIQACYCDRNFTVEEMKKIITDIRKATFYNKKSIYSYYTDKLFSNETQLPDEQKNYEKMTQVINDTFKKYEINTCIRKIHFLAQAYWETGYFTRTKEVGTSLKYDPYRGRGFMQLTGVILGSGKVVAGVEDSRTKNATAYLGYKKYSDIDVVTTPDLISKSIYNSADSGGWFWKYGKLLTDGSILDLNTIADEDNLSRVSFLVNGGTNGKQERIDAYNALKKVIDYENCNNKK